MTTEEWKAYLAAHPDLDAVRRSADRPQAWVFCDACGARFDRYAHFLDHGDTSALRLMRHTLTTSEDLLASVCSEECRSTLTGEWEGR